MYFVAVAPSIVTPNLLLRCSTRFLSNLGQDWRLHHHQEGPLHRGGVNGHGNCGEIMGKSSGKSWGNDDFPPEKIQGYIERYPKSSDQMHQNGIKIWHLSWTDWPSRFRRCHEIWREQLEIQVIPSSCSHRFQMAFPSDCDTSCFKLLMLQVARTQPRDTETVTPWLRSYLDRTWIQNFAFWYQAWPRPVVFGMFGPNLSCWPTIGSSFKTIAVDFEAAQLPVHPMRHGWQKSWNEKRMVNAHQNW